MSLKKRVQQYRHSPVYRVLEVLPTKARPWLLALDLLSEWRLERQATRFQHRETKMFDHRRPQARRKGNLGRVLLMSGLVFAASKLLQRSQRQAGSRPLGRRGARGENEPTIVQP